MLIDIDKLSTNWDSLEDIKTDAIPIEWLEEKMKILEKIDTPILPWVLIYTLVWVWRLENAD